MPSLQNVHSDREIVGALVAEYIEVVQNKAPKIERDGENAPASHPVNPKLEWCPPGHGDLYATLRGSGQSAASLIEMHSPACGTGGGRERGLVGQFRGAALPG